MLNVISSLTIMHRRTQGRTLLKRLVGKPVAAFNETKVQLEKLPHSDFLHTRTMEILDALA